MEKGERDSIFLRAVSSLLIQWSSCSKSEHFFFLSNLTTGTKRKNRFKHALGLPPLQKEVANSLFLLRTFLANGCLRQHLLAIAIALTWCTQLLLHAICIGKSCTQQFSMCFDAGYVLEFHARSVLPPRRCHLCTRQTLGWNEKWPR